MPRSDFDPQRTEAYDNRQVFAKRLHLSIPHAARMAREGIAPTPDVLILPKHKGWSEERENAYARDAGLVDEQGNKGDPPTSGSKVRRADLRALVAAFYGGPPALYLGPSLLGSMYGVATEALFARRWRKQTKSFEADVVTLGDKAPRFGWEELRSLRYGKQAQGLTEAGVTSWAIRRTTEHGLPVTDWVRDRAKEKTGTDLKHPELAAWLEQHGQMHADFWDQWQPTMTPEEIDAWVIERTLLHHRPVTDWVRRWAENRPRVHGWLTEWDEFLKQHATADGAVPIVSRKEIDAWVIQRTMLGGDDKAGE